MLNSIAWVIGLHWVAVLFYVVASVLVIFGIIFKKETPARFGTLAAYPGLAVHGAALLLWWRIVGHGPYMDRFEVLSSNAWVLLAIFLLITRVYRQLKPAGVVVFPATFLLVAISLFLRPEIKRLPATFRGIWLVLHIIFYKIAFTSIIVAFAFSLFYIMKEKNRLQRLSWLPELGAMDLYAYRFAGFGFTFWAIGMLAGSIWAYQSWNIFWSWDPVQTWSLVTWAVFGLYLHLRRFFGWAGTRAAWLYCVSFLLTLLSLFFTPFIQSSIHAEYFK